MTTATVRCKCGEVEGRIADAAPGAVNRVVCYCDDCQAFAHHLGRADLLDGHGGTDIVQTAPAKITFTKGQENLAAVRLSPKGLYRWYARCCNTPMGNTVGPKLPFVGIVAQALGDADAVVGKPTGAILARYAIGEVPAAARGMPVGLVVRAVAKVLGWKLTGKSWPHPFFERATGAPKYPVHVIGRAERDALRRLCGPRPA